MQPQSFDELLQQNTLRSSVQSLAPVATSWHGATQNAPVGITAQKSTRQGALQKFTGKVGDVVGQGAHIAGDFVKTVAKEAIDGVTAIPKTPYYAAQAVLDNQALDAINKQTNLNSAALDGVMRDFKAGRITRDQCQKALAELNSNNDSLVRQTAELTTKIKNDKQATQDVAIDLAGDAIAILTAGVASGAAVAGDAGTTAYVKFFAGGAESKLTSSLLNASKAVDTVLAKVPGISIKAPESFSSKVIQDITNTAIKSGAKDITVQQSMKNVAINIALKRPLIYNQLIEGGEDIYKELETGKYGDAAKDVAIFASMALAGGPVGWAFKKAGAAANTAKRAVFGDFSMIDEISKRIGAGEASAMYAFLSKPENAEIAKSVSNMLETNLKVSKGNRQAAIDRVLRWYDQENGIPLSSLDAEKLCKDLHFTYVDQQAVRQELKAAGFEQWNRVVVGRWAQDDIKRLGKAIKAADDKILENGGTAEDVLAARRSVIEELQSRHGRSTAWLNSDTLQAKLDILFQTYDNTDDLIAAINTIDAQKGLPNVSRKLKRELAKNGHIAIIPDKGYAGKYADEVGGKLVSEFADNAEHVFEKAVQPLQVLKPVGAVLAKTGLSPQDADGVVQQAFRDNLDAGLRQSLSGTKLARETDKAGAGADRVLKALSNYMRTPVAEGEVKELSRKFFKPTDFRQLSTSEIKDALRSFNITDADAKEVKRAIMTAMLKVPLEARGLGERLMDMNYAINPIAGAFTRGQMAGRYVYNPFFNWQKVTETEFLAQMGAGGKSLTYGPTDWLTRHIFRTTYDQIDATVSMLTKKGVLGDELAMARVAHAAGGSPMGAVGTKLLKSEKRSLAGMVQSMAKKAGMTTDEFVDNFQPEVEDALRIIVGYGKNESFVNSPLARTLNFAFFPARYNIKVAGMMAKYVSRMSAPTQVAMIHSMMQFSDWLNADEGQQWYAQNADVIGVFNYISPLWSLNQLGKILHDVKNPEDTHVGDFGLLGGLPFGFISQMLEGQGLATFSAPYVDAKTGQQIPDYIPITTRGRVSTAIQDLLGQLFSYPGATMGLTSKGTVLRTTVGGLTGAKTSTDYATKVPQISDQQKQFQQNAAIAAGLDIPTGMKPVAFHGPIIEVELPQDALKSQLTAPEPTKQTKKRKKKADYTPALLPGQTTLGQL